MFLDKTFNFVHTNIKNCVFNLYDDKFKLAYLSDNFALNFGFL